ncbi:unnamed protein product [Dibothriocephalus latus]|uniref:DUF4743 domain-containing protein n=1 Tax=Dibothriocephalus latus TaxID=60516 RepID=A0A3P7P0Z2_DIBLA|nr:unnamed protein product [Dibothriocephalus latus]
MKFFVDNYFVGLIHPEFCGTLLQHPEAFVKGVDPSSEKPCIRLNPNLKSFAERTAAVEDHYGVYVNGRTEALLSIERTASRVLGTNRHNVHINGYTFLNDGLPSARRQTTLSDILAMNIEGDETEPELKLSNVPHNLRIWITRRSPSRPKYPNLLDNLVRTAVICPLSFLVQIYDPHLPSFTFCPTFTDYGLCSYPPYAPSSYFNPKSPLPPDYGSNSLAVSNEVRTVP